ncbi:MAG: GyrI-like protein [Devosia sp.]|nr:GyrI-like protein [Devosia sp.]
MLTEPKIVEKTEQPFAAMVLTLSQPEIASVAPPLIDEVIAWIKAQGGQPVGASFFNYVNFFPDGKMEMQVGMPTDTLLVGDSKITTGTLPGGLYASITATAPYHELNDAHMKLDSWAKASGHQLDGTVVWDRFMGATRIEIYHKDPGEDPSGFPVTEVAFRLE